MPPAGPAHINSLEVIRKLRSDYLEFDATCRRALDGARGDVARIQDWLRREQLGYWQNQLRRREEATEQARRDYQSARYSQGFDGKHSCVDEKKALDRALRLKAEAEEKLRAVKRWLLNIEREVGDLSGACQNLGSLLDTVTPQALERLDRMLDNLDQYLRLAPPGPAS